MWGAKEKTQPLKVKRMETCKGGIGGGEDTISWKKTGAQRRFRTFWKENGVGREPRQGNRYKN